MKMINIIYIRTFFILCIVGVYAKGPRQKNLCDKANFSKLLKCKPRKVLVNILPDLKEVSPQITPSIVQVNRCLGFTGSLNCVAVASVNITVMVNQGTKCKNFFVQQHTKCKLKPVKHKEVIPSCGTEKRWNPKESRCECFTKCTTGSEFDRKSCRCVLTTTINSLDIN